MLSSLIAPFLSLSLSLIAFTRLLYILCALYSYVIIYEVEKYKTNVVHTCELRVRMFMNK